MPGINCKVTNLWYFVTGRNDHILIVLCFIFQRQIDEKLKNKTKTIIIYKICYCLPSYNYVVYSSIVL